jgi:small conductance mechanosensitive channel
MTLAEKLDAIKLGSVSVNDILSAVLAFIVCFIVIKILRKINRKALERSKLDTGLASFIESALKVVLWIGAGLVIADCLNIPVTSLVALVSVAGLALSLALQGLLSNVFSGITILGTHPFRGGDFVDISGQSGTVRAIGLFHTLIVTPDGKEVYVPNSSVTASNIINYTAESTRRVELKFSASYDDPTDKVRSAILESVSADARILSEPAPFVGVDSYGGSAVNYVCRAWVKPEDYWDVYYSLNAAVRESFAKNGVVMTYDHLNVHVLNS